MNSKIFLQKTSNLFVENRLLKFVVVVLAGATIVNSVMVHKALRYQRTILIPPTMTGTIEFVEGRPTEQYLRDIARRIASLAATYSPATARGQFDELLAFYAPEKYPNVAKEWYSLASRIEETLVTSVFYLRKISIGEKHMEISGDYMQFADEQRIESGPKTYIIEYEIRDGRFYMLSFREKETAS